MKIGFPQFQEITPCSPTRQHRRFFFYLYIFVLQLLISSYNGTEREKAAFNLVKSKIIILKVQKMDRFHADF